jgi:hypothetical protein
MKFKINENFLQTLEKLKQGKYDQLTPEEKAEIDAEYHFFLKANQGEEDNLHAWKQWLNGVLGDLNDPDYFQRPHKKKTDKEKEEKEEAEEFIRYAKNKGIEVK